MGVDTNSIVDYLRFQGQNSSFAARRYLWHSLFPDQLYQGTASQNQKLLAFLRTEEQVPILRLERLVVPTGSELIAIAEGITKVGIESPLLGQSTEVSPGAKVNLGAIDRFGFIPIHVFDGSLATTMQLVATPSSEDGNIDVGLWTVPYEFEEATMPLLLSEPSEIEIVTNFLTFIAANPDVLFDAALEAFPEFFADDKWVGIGLDALIGVSLFFVSGPAGVGFYLLRLAPGYGIDLVLIWLQKTVDKLPESPQFPVQARNFLKNAIVRAGRISRLAFGGFKVIKGSKDMCERAMTLTELPNWAIEGFDLQPDPDLAVAGKMLNEFVNKSVVIACELTKKK